jgi:RNA polymerase sigma factor (sigma-70 family)
VSQQVKIRRRECAETSLQPAGTDEDGNEVEEFLSYLARQRAESQRLLAEGGVEERAVLRLTLRAALVQLRPEERQLIAMWLNEYSFPEIAAQLNIRVDACYQRFHRALARLRSVLEKEFGGGSQESPV